MAQPRSQREQGPGPGWCTRRPGRAPRGRRAGRLVSLSSPFVGARCARRDAIRENRRMSTARVKSLSPQFLLRISIVVAIVTIGLKTLAWWITQSVGLLSDAMESLVNLA